MRGDFRVIRQSLTHPNLRSALLGIVFAVLGVAALALTIGLSNQQLHAAAASADLSEAKARITSLCSSSSNAVAHAGYPSDIKLDESTGKVTYKLNVIWKRCSSSASTKYYAITGYEAKATNGTLAVCEIVGWYSSGTKSNPQTRDCVKYTQPVHASFGTPSNPGSKITSDFWGGAKAGIQAPQPPTSLEGPKVISLTGQVADWKNTRWTSKSAKLGAKNALCSYYIDLKANTDAGGRMCQDVYVTVSWLSYKLQPTVGSLPSSITQESETFSVPGTVAHESSSLTSSHAGVNWRMTQLVFAPGVTPNAVNASAMGCADAPAPTATPTGKCDLIGSGAFAEAITRSSPKNVTATSRPGSWAVGTSICFRLSISRFGSDSGSTGWRNSGLKCTVISKRPKVQVWGGALRVENAIQPEVSNVTTSLTTFAATTKHVPAPARLFSGNWKTGVSSSGAKLGENVSDPHWVIDRVYNGAGYATCERGYNSSGSLAWVPSTAGANFQARTIMEGRGQAGWWIGRGVAVSIVGVDNGVNGGYVWGRVGTTPSRWIGLNVYGRHYSSSACPDPTYNLPNHIERGNTTVFKLRDGITIDSTVDLATLKLTIEGAVDNQVKFYANGCELKAAPGMRIAANNWQEPGWWSTSKAGAVAQPVGSCAQPTGFKHGKNTFEIHVRSDFSHIGLLIDKFEFTAQANEVVPAVTFGSHSEYEISATGEVNGMASAAGLSGGNAQSTQKCWSLLTFANDTAATGGGSGAGCNSPGPYGGFLPVRTTAIAPRLEDRYAVKASTPKYTSIDINSVSKNRVITGGSSGDVTITGGQLERGEWLVINASTRTVNITGNIQYTSESLGSVKDIPQLIILANEINIQGNVTQVDAWLVARTGIATCSDKGGVTQLNRAGSSLPTSLHLTTKDCANQLRVNGPVITKSLWLRRTAGSTSKEQADVPAEIFNLRPDVYLWAQAQSQYPRVKTTKITELPPRF